jgi:hypothetical protein
MQVPEGLAAAAVVGALVVGGLIGWAVIPHGSDAASSDVLGFKANEPPPEYLYLDTARVLAYLGQIDGGLTTAERRTFQQTDEFSGGLNTHGFEASAKQQHQKAVEQEVTAGATDRFYRLLGALKDGRSSGHRWLFTVDARLHGTHTVFSVERTLRHLRVGDFVRVTRARAYVAPYAAVYPKTSYSLNYLGGDLAKPLHPLFAQVSKKARRAARAYADAVGDNPRIPIVVPTLNEDRTTTEPVKFVVPVRHDGLSSEPSSLAGEMTIVGKIIYLDPRLASHVAKSDPNAAVWVDQETVHTFAPALEHAQAPLLRLLHLGDYVDKRKQLAGVVRRSVTFSAPIVVVLPIAIYQ